MQDPILAVLTADFKNHVENEARWQEAVLDRFDLVAKKLDDLQSMETDVQEHRITLFGVSPDKDNGLNRDMKSIKVWKQAADARWYKMVAVLFAIQFLFNIAGPYLKDMIFPHEKQDKTTQEASPIMK